MTKTDATEVGRHSHAAVAIEESLVSVRGLTIRIPTQYHGEQAWVHAATEVSMDLDSGRVHALIGESGCGKSILASTLIGMLPANTCVQGEVSFDGRDISNAVGDQQANVWKHLRGREIGMVFQSSATFLTPTRTVGSQLRETLKTLGSLQTSDAILQLVNLDPEVVRLYPHELSGGMAGRLAIGFALCGNPRLIVADEPTANLDLNLKQEMFQLLGQCANQGACVFLITHDIDALLRTNIADQLSVMYAGRIVETGSPRRVAHDPRHPYTKALFNALPTNGFIPIPGMPPTLTNLRVDETFESRIKRAEELCLAE